MHTAVQPKLQSQVNSTSLKFKLNSWDHDDNDYNHNYNNHDDHYVDKVYRSDDND